MTKTPTLRPARRGPLVIAFLISLVTHTLIVGLFATSNRGGAPRPQPRMLDARLAPLTATPSTIANARQPQIRPVLAPSIPSPPTITPNTPPQPTPQTTNEPPAAATEIPAYYLPLASLTREPELLSEVSPDGWPLLPDSPTGVFRLELAINPEGHIDQILTHCEPRLCPAAERYAGIVRNWQFQPGEILGRTVPSRLTLEFELGDPPPNAAQAPRQ